MKKFSDVIKKANHAYELQVVRTCEVRLKCIELIASQRFENMNLFWTLFMQRADELLDSRRFVAEAKRLGEDPILIATNVVARGAGLVAKVSKFGIVGSGINVSEYCCLIVPDAIAERFMSNPEEFYSKEDAPEDAKAEMAEAPLADDATAA